MPPAGEGTDGSWSAGDSDHDSPVLSALLEDSAEDLYENAPCAYLSTLMDGRIAKANGTLLKWLGYRREELVGHKHFSDLLTVGGRLYHRHTSHRCCGYRARSTASPWNSRHRTAPDCPSWSPPPSSGTRMANRY